MSTDYWLIMVEGIILQQNQSMEVKMALHSGLWRVCFVAGRRKHTHEHTDKHTQSHSNSSSKRGSSSGGSDSTLMVMTAERWIHVLHMAVAHMHANYLFACALAKDRRIEGVDQDKGSEEGRK